MKRICFTLANGKRKYPKVGDFVQIMSWFDDCWAEIMDVDHVVPGYKCIRYYTDVTNLGYDSVYETLPSSVSNYVLHQIRNIVSRQALSHLPVRVIHCKEGTYGRSKNPYPRSLSGMPLWLS